MGKTINQGFEEFHNKLKISQTETEATSSHRKSISICLKNNFGLNRFVKIGSFGNGTNINGYSDTDYLTSLPPNVFTSSSDYMLLKVKNVLENRFPDTGIKIDNPTVVCPFGKYPSERTELVIAKEVDSFRYVDNEFPVYEISDSNNGWMKICPDAHNDYVKEVDYMRDNKLKPLIRFIKAWKYYNNVPISSFYLEMFVARYALNEKSIIYYWDIANILRKLKDNQLSDLNDPTGFSSRIKACKTQNFKDDCLSKLDTAISRAEKAKDCIKDKLDIPDAFYWLGRLYNDNFPKYE